ncbi:unnamed protein product [Triticum turgidum subsp. durum]|uniref:Uncharacterized protein n=1 Tax=Triticum turgidum subsp. durum TaxID=4567 RepID=A0A9R0ZJ04_TRITD|nr:unnamed protein product [Triticum turgidum subsp. durum]
MDSTCILFNSGMMNSSYCCSDILDIISKFILLLSDSHVRDRLKAGTGSAKNSDRRRDKGLLVEIAIMVAHTASDLSCWMVNCSSTQVLHFQDFIPCPISQSSFNVLMSMDWQSFGFKLKGGFMDDEGNAVLEWDNLTFARVDIAIHTYHGIYPAIVLCILSFSIDCLGVDIHHGFFPSVFL